MRCGRGETDALAEIGVADRRILDQDVNLKAADAQTQATDQRVRAPEIIFGSDLACKLQLKDL